MISDWTGALPAARSEHLVITELGNELLAYDTGSHQLHQLNPVATAVWRSLDGIRNAADVLVLVRAELDTVVTLDSILLALSTLSDANLLTSPIEVGAVLGNQSRRGFLKKLGIAGVAVPMVASVSAPLAAAHSSGTCKSDCNFIITKEDELNWQRGYPCYNPRNPGNSAGQCLGICQKTRVGEPSYCG